MIPLKRVALCALSVLVLTTSATARTHRHPGSTNTASVSSATSARQSLPAGEWPQAHSDLKADAAVRFGALPNGMRYAIMRNATPPGQVAMRLRFAVGSLMESDDEQGLAHFLEHMAFNGSTNVPTRGQMVEDLERLGLSFGADTNAGTGFDETVYKFNLPKSDAQTVDTSMHLLREIAGNLLLTQDAMDKERGVILSEERQRDVPSYRLYKAQQQFMLEGQRPPQRYPIGLVSVIQNAKRDRLQDLYDKYYRPERATLVIVGDIDPDAIEAKIKSLFGDWQGKGEPGADPDLGRIKAHPVADFRVAVEPGAGQQLQLAWLTPPDLSADTRAKETDSLIERLGFAVLDRRLGALARGDNPPFISAAAGRYDMLHAERVTAVLVNAQPGHWQEALKAAETEVRRALAYGVRPDELAREVAEEEALFKTQAAQAGTRQTPALADEIVSTVGERLVDTSPADDLALFEEVTKNLTADQVNAALKAAFAGEGPLVFLGSPTPVTGGAKQVRVAYAAAKAAPVAAPEAPHQVDWPYLAFGSAPGKVAERKDVADLDTVFVRFDNGVRLTVKPTKFAADQVLVKVRFGGGLASLPPDHPSITWAGGAFTEGGLKQISVEDRDRALNGQLYGAGLGFENDAFVLSGSTRTGDVPTQLQVLAAYLTDPGWRPEAMARIKSVYAAAEDQLDGSDSAVLGRDLNGLLHAGDARFVFPSRDAVASASLDDLKNLLASPLAKGSIEIVMVGDITVDKAIDEVGETFGALPRRPDPAPPAPPANGVHFPAPVATPLVETHNGRPDQGVALIAWPTDDIFANPQGARVNTILGDVLRLRLIDSLRLKEGVTYSPVAYASPSLVFPHYGFILADMEAPPAKLPGFFADLTDITADLRAKPVSDDELERAKKPEIDALEKAQATNGYWLEVLSGAEADPRRLDLIRTHIAQLEHVSAADVQKAAQTWLIDAKAWRLEVEPKVSVAAR